jgi:beta-lactamase superfamily II metal-dependent hydrolase
MSTVTPNEPNPHRKRIQQITLVVLALCILAWRSWPDGRLRVIFLETRGDAALIQTPSGGYVLIDGGSDPAALAAALGRQMPFWHRALDMVVLTTAEGSSLPGAIAALTHYRAGGAIVPHNLKHGAWSDEWRHLLAEQHTPLHVARAGDRVNLGGATLRVLASGDGDEDGLVLRLDYGATSVVFDQSGGPAEEGALAARSLRPASLLVFPWQRDPHVEFVAALRPASMVLSDGRQADQPAELTFVERAIGGATLYHERLDGTITWTSDGLRSWVQTER